MRMPSECTCHAVIAPVVVNHHHRVCKLRSSSVTSQHLAQTLVQALVGTRAARTSEYREAVLRAATRTCVERHEVGGRVADAPLDYVRPKVRHRLFHPRGEEGVS